MIYVFGDSHRSFFTDTHPGESRVDRRGRFVSHTLGPGTAHNFYEKRHTEMMLTLSKANPNSGVVVVAGEIDCRLHIPKIHLETGKSLPSLIDATVDRFMVSLLDLQRWGFKVIAWGPHPTRHLETLDYNPEWYAGDQRMRNQTCLAFNGALHRRAAEHKIPFATAFYNIIKEYDDYTVHNEAYRDPLHLSQILWPATEKLLGELYDNYADFQ